jgi:hypothetical protein
MKLRDCRTAGPDTQEREYGVHEAGPTGQYHAAAEPGGPEQMRSVALADGGRMFGEEAPYLHLYSLARGARYRVAKTRSFGAN